MVFLRRVQRCCSLEHTKNEDIREEKNIRVFNLNDRLKDYIRWKEFLERMPDSRR